MAASLKLIRRPRTRKMWPIVRDELKAAYTNILFPVVVERYIQLGNLASWDNKVHFKLKVHLSSKRIKVEFGVDKRFKGSKILLWVDRGTGLEGPEKRTYVIVAKNISFDAAYPLHFSVPYQPLTYPTEALRYDPSAAEHWVKSWWIDHPGIQARNWTEEVLEWVKDRHNTKGFYRITENAYRRAFTKVKRQGLS